MGFGSIWNWIVLIVFIGVILAAIYWTARAARVHQGPDGPVGVGGWLILPIIGFIITTLLTSYNLFTALAAWEGLRNIFTAADGPLATIRIPTTLSLVAGVAIIFSALWCLYRIFVSKRPLRVLASAHFVLLAISGVVEYWGDGVMAAAFPDVGRDPTALSNAVRGVVAAAIWIPYFNVSRRVRNTFERTGPAFASR